MLRLDPAHPPLWRTATTMQFGADPVAVIADPEPWQQRLVRRLEHGIPDDAFDAIAVAAGASSADALALLDDLRPALAAHRPAAPARVVLEVPDDFPRVARDALIAALVAGGTEVVSGHEEGERGADAAPVVVVAHHLIEPRRAAALMAGDIRHLPILLTGRGAQVGPFVIPGQTPCLACDAAHRRDADPAWPMLAAQLVGRAADPVDAAVVCEAGIVASRLLSDAVSPATASRSVTLHADSLQRSAQEHPPHAECGCRSLAGTATDAVHELPEPTTSRACARRA